MSHQDPQRWLDDGDLDPEVAELLSSAMQPRAMSSAERMRTARRIGRFAAVPVAAGALLMVRTVALAAVIGSASGAVLATVAREVVLERPAAVAPVAPAPVRFTHGDPPRTAPHDRVRDEAPAEPAPSAPASSAKPEATTSSPSTAAAPSSAQDTLALEAALLESARQALADDPSRALRLLADHARSYPAGKLSMERELLVIEALNRAGRGGEAQARARALLARSPGSLYEARLRRLIGE
jgi:hypothetical protein